MLFTCPICQNNLSKNNSQLVCKNNHSFDFAKEGYVNLLPANKKKSKFPGDSLEMMQARRDFLAENHYKFLAENILKELQKFDLNNILDLGCGEGYYTNFLQQNLKNSNIYGIDIAKPAIKKASKLNKNINFIIASNKNIPLKDNSFDAVIKIFAPCEISEIERILKNNGYFISVTPAPKHLFELKQEIYNDVKLHSHQPEIFENFNLIQTNIIENRVELNSNDWLNLANMTPFTWKLSNDKKQNLSQNSKKFNMTFAFMVSIYQKN